MNEIFAHIVFADYGGQTTRRAAFAAEPVTAEGVKGFLVRLPITGAEAAGDKVGAVGMLQRALDALANQGVDIVLQPEGLAADVKGMAVARGADIMPFLLPRAAKKALAAIGKEFARCEIAVLCEDATVAAQVLGEMGPMANFMTLAGAHDRLDALRETAAGIYRETGLEAVLSEDMRQAVSRADVVIHTAPPQSAYANLYKRGCVSLDLSGSRGMTASLLARRPDITAADGLYVSMGKTTFPQDVLALALYGKSDACARLVREGYTPETAVLVRRDLAQLRVTVAAFAQAGRALSMSGLARRAMNR